MLLNNIFRPPPATKDAACAMRAPAASQLGADTSSLALQVFEPLSSLVQRHLFGCIHHSLPLDLPVKAPALQFFSFGQIPTSVLTRSLLGRVAKQRLHSVCHDLVRFDLQHISALFADSRHFVHALRRRCIHNNRANTRFIRVADLPGRHAFVSRLALRIGQTASGCHYQRTQKASFHPAVPPVLGNRNLCGGAA